MTNHKTVFSKTVRAKKHDWLVEGWIGISGKAHCTIYKFKDFYWGQVHPSELPLVPASVLKANVQAMEKAQAAARA